MDPPRARRNFYIRLTIFPTGAHTSISPATEATAEVSEIFETAGGDVSTRRSVCTSAVCVLFLAGFFYQRATARGALIASIAGSLWAVTVTVLEKMHLLPHIAFLTVWVGDAATGHCLIPFLTRAGIDGLFACAILWFFRNKTEVIPEQAILAFVADPAPEENGAGVLCVRRRLVWIGFGNHEPTMNRWRHPVALRRYLVKPGSAGFSGCNLSAPGLPRFPEPTTTGASLCAF